eukprot:Gb_33769 [translate_table: standard]
MVMVVGLRDYPLQIQFGEVFELKVKILSFVVYHVKVPTNKVSMPICEFLYVHLGSLFST